MITGSDLNGTSIRLCRTEQACFGNGSRLGQIHLLLGSSLYRARFDSIRAVIDAMGGHGSQDRRTQLIPLLGTRPAGRGEGDQGLQRPFEAEVPGTNPGPGRRLGHEHADQVIREQVHPNLLTNHSRALAPQGSAKCLSLFW